MRTLRHSRKYARQTKKRKYPVGGNSDVGNTTKTKRRLCSSVPEDITWYLSGELANTIKTQVRKTKKEDPCTHYNSPYPDPDWVENHPEKNITWNLDSFLQSANYWMVEDENLPGSIIPHLLAQNGPALVNRLSKEYHRPRLSAFMHKLTATYPHLFHATCIYYGFVAFLKYGYKRMNIPIDETTTLSAAAAGNYKLLVYLRENGCPWNESTCAFAAQANQLKCLQYAHENGCPWNKTTCEYAANAGHLDCLEYAHENGCPWDKLTCTNAADGGHLVCLKYAHENGCPWDNLTCTNAAKGGHLACLKYAHENGCPWDRERMCLNSMGHLDCVKYVFSCGCPLDYIDEDGNGEDFCDAAAEEGHLDCLQFGHEHGGEWDETTCSYAVIYGELDCLKYAHENGCPWDEETILGSIHYGQLECLKYAHVNGCDYDKATCLNIAREAIEEEEDPSKVTDINRCVQYVNEHM
jgi:hypothetical protein